MTRSLLIVLFLFSISSQSFAGKIEVAQWVPWKFVTSGILKASFDESISEPSFELDAGELKPKAQGLIVSANGRVSDISINSAGLTSIQEAGLSLQINKLIIDQLITREFNGNQIQVRIKAECSPIRVEVPHFEIISGFNFVISGDHWLPKIQQINIDIPDNGWRISSFTCSGIGGIGEEITSQLKNALKKPETFLVFVYPWLGQKINHLVHSSWESLKNSANEGMKILSMGKPLNSGIFIHGELSIETNKKIPLPALNETQFSDTLPQLVISAAGFEAILEDKFLSLVPNNYDLQKVPAFKELMKSRLAQYFVWPDLRRFPSSNSFYLGIDPTQTRLRLARENNQWKAILNSNGFIKTTIGGSLIDYIQFGIGVSTPMQILVQDGELKISNSAVDLKMAWSYGLLYQLIYRPNNRIAVDILKNALKDFFTNQSATQILPAIRWGEKDLKLQNWREHNDIITMDWL